jgi:hypothetical protein
MGKLLMLAGGIVEPAKGGEATVSAYVALSAGRQSRLFRVNGPAASIKVTELAAATTVDTGRFQRDLEEDLAPTLLALRVHGEPVHITRPKDAWVTGLVRDHLKKTEGLEVG